MRFLPLRFSFYASRTLMITTTSSSSSSFASFSSTLSSPTTTLHASKRTIIRSFLLLFSLACCRLFSRLGHGRVGHDNLLTGGCSVAKHLGCSLKVIPCCTQPNRAFLFFGQILGWGIVPVLSFFCGTGVGDFSFSILFTINTGGSGKSGRMLLFSVLEAKERGIASV
ncbi:hypothetical protein B0T21DRAFT_25608 [Apiosordaria backusii]|uniref:Uncharacterized protein n=1 Tax=Apiosordaria backusii TaxID=314023 RepID=A0AA40EZV2_9PEZI|nr:hypothetical protein B0T21DRAFT_25608 [Apiosordaria backusii]